MYQDTERDIRYIYVVFIMTNTYLGKMIRVFTRNEYNHVTLACDQDLSNMYSFARYHINSPIAGGFVIEQPGRYIKGNSDVKIKICRLPITKSKYERIHKEILHFQIHKEKMIYNTFNAVLSLCRKRIPAKDTYTCLEFVTYLLRMKNITAIKELEKRLDQYVIYSGSLRKITGKDYIENDEFFKERCLPGVVIDTVHHLGRIVYRINSND